jgi:hypothetical protein
MAWYNDLWDAGVDYVTKNPVETLTAAANLYGGYKTANQLQDAANTNASAIQQSTKAAADAAQFKPYSISTGFGSSYFDTEKNRAGYELDPLLTSFRNQMYGLGADFLGQAQTDPQAAAQQYYNQQQGLMAGGRQAEDIALRQQQLQQGRIGLGLSGASQGAGAGTGYVNPQQYQQQLARSMADQQLAANSQQLAQADIDKAIARGTGLLQSGFGVEEMGLRPLTIGADIGSRQAVSGGNQAQALLAGGQGAANANLAGSIASAQALQGGIKGFTGLFSPQK